MRKRCEIMFFRKIKLSDGARSPGSSSEPAKYHREMVFGNNNSSLFGADYCGYCCPFLSRKTFMSSGILCCSVMVQSIMPLNTDSSSSLAWSLLPVM